MSEAPAGPAPAASPQGEPPPSGFVWFASSVASWFGAWGMQAVLFSWLVVGELRASAEWVGVAQTSTMIPMLLLVLLGGALADRVDPRRILIALHLAAAIPALLLAGVVATGRLSLPGVIAYGLCLGTIGAFSMPARDALLSRVAGRDLMRGVTGMTAAQFGAQAAGSLLAGAARWLGTPAMLGVQAVVFSLGSFAARRLEPAALSASGPAGPTLHGIRQGLWLVARTPALRGPLLLTVAVGFLFVGPFLVLFPLLVRDVYGGGVAALSLVLMLFPVGTIAGSLLLRSRGGLVRKGRAALLALAAGAGILLAIGQGLPFPGFVAATLAWGLAGSVFINASRTLYQEAAPATRRGRVLAVYQLGFMGAGPLGALCAGFAGGRIGSLETLQVFAVGMLGVVAAGWLLSTVPTLE